ncbi:MAG: ribosome biogenesis GTPase YlqF [Alphaproteobacteria bacterium]|nr:MAG: ribosome biogenesis GTPase YlqF [Alphaproteobacteria bacterium]
MKNKNNKNKNNQDGVALTPDTPVKLGINWYPGHMAKAIREIKEKLKLVDIVLEIRDARAPLASGNFALDDTLRQKSRLIVMNKVNLADPKIIHLWDEWFKAKGEPYIFIDCFDKASMKKVMSHARSIVDQKRKESNPETYQQKAKLKLMVIGLPNTGKSTIINQLANRTATKTADRPGQTQVQQWIVIDKDLDLLDTPGVMPPILAKAEHGLWLSAIHAIPDDIVGEELPAKFLVEHFKGLNSKEFKERYKLESLDLEVEEILEKIAVLRGCVRQKGLADLERVYKLILLDFRRGELGKCCFGLPPVIS